MTRSRASVSLANVQAEAKDGTVFGLTDANNQGLVNQTFYKYATVSGTAGYVPLSPVTNDKLDPYVGYWVHAYQPCTLLVPARAVGRQRKHGGRRGRPRDKSKQS